MCGIGGVIRWGNKPIEEQQVAKLLVGNEHRGNDASGLVIQQEDGSLQILKNDTPGWKLVASKDYKEFIEKHLLPTTRGVLVHARGASQGNPRDNNNNHPMFAGKTAVVHNGVIRNDSSLFGSLRLDRKAETDSDILRAILDDQGLTESGIKMLGRCSGSGAIAAVSPDYPGKVLIVRSGNPLVLGSNEDFLFFSSEKATLHKACRPHYERKGIWFQSQKPDIDFSNMPNHTGWILGPTGVEKHIECHICTGEYTEPWRKTYENYAERQEKWNRQARPGSSTGEMKPAWCHMCKREWMIPKDAVYTQWSCNIKEGGCGRSLWQPISILSGKVN